jgi:hypothetical protein
MINLDNSPDIVKKAYNYGITDLGQLTKKEKYELDKAAKRGILFKTKSFKYPIPKTFYTINIQDYLESLQNCNIDS